MKPFITYIFLIALIGSVFQINAQQKSTKKAHDLFNNFAYSEAIDSYKKIIKKGNGSFEIYKRLGDCYYYTSNLKDAARWYDKMWKRQEEIKTKAKDVSTLEDQTEESFNISAEYYFRTAQSYKFMKRYKASDSLMVLLKSISSEDSRVKRLIEQPDYLDKIALQSGRYSIKNISQNSLGVDFAPSFYKEEIVFSSSRSNKSSVKKNTWTNQPYLNLYKFTNSDSLELNYSLKLPETLNSKFHESTSSFSKDGKMVYFTRNNLSGAKLGKDSLGVSHLKIYKASLNQEFEWNSIKELPFNNNQYSVAHPSLNADGTKLYFASDMPGGYGMSDLYVVEINKDGTFGNLQNLGPGINTEGRDSFPFMSKSGILYFASDGHLGLGGFDVFAIGLNDRDKNVYNLGEPVNSAADDVTFIIDDRSKKGFFASNRSGGKGSDDIYSFEETKPLVTICKGSFKGIVKDQKSGNVIPETKVEIKNQEQEIIYKGLTDFKGVFSLELDCADQAYEITLAKKDFDTKVQKISFSRDEPKKEQILNLKSNLPEKGTDLAKLLNLEPIYFASNKALVIGNTAKELDKIVAFMKENQSIRIEIGSHTDSKGKDSYNMKLSQRRAKSTANYIISKGIDSSRVKSRGYGETILINKCGNRVECSKDEHALNRRSEFVVLDN
ncbi:OmpA family protein [Aquimarina aggregata]|nr:OmpA family protein [Aquimarina aggregata]